MCLEGEIVSALQITVGSRLLRLIDVRAHMLDGGLFVGRKRTAQAAKIVFGGFQQLGRVEFLMKSVVVRDGCR